MRTDQSSRRDVIRALPVMLVVPLLIGASGAAIGSDEPVIETADGRLRGVRKGPTVSFKGIPYAADTGGRNRFMAPRPVPRWSGVRDATAFGARAPQGPRPAAARSDAASPAGYGEDCCVLNVFTPHLRSGAKLPVLVFIHGGGFRSGSGDGPTADGANLATFGNVVVVTLNHRLNVLGYASLGLLHPDFADAANAGQLDLVAALTWIRTNIAAFGGDAGRVTLFGVSGGGSAIETLAIMPDATGLFHRAINMSGTSAFAMKTAAEMAPVAETFLKTLGLDRAQVHKVQELPPEQLLAAYDTASRVHDSGDYRPVIDGRHLHHAPLSREGLALSTRFPTIMSCTATEATPWLAADRRNTGVTAEQVRARIAAQFGIDAARAGAVMAAYREEVPARSPWDILVAVSTDALVRGPMRRVADAKAALRKAPVYRCDFTWASPKDGGMWGAAHASDVAFAFGNLQPGSLAAPTDPGAAATQRAEMSAFVAMATRGDPNNAAMPRWTVYDAVRRPTMVINATCRMVDDYRSGDRRASEMLPVQDAFQIVAGPLFRYTA